MAESLHGWLYDRITNSFTAKRGLFLSVAVMLFHFTCCEHSRRDIPNKKTGMIRRIEKGEANAILTWKLDRLARNFEDGGKIIGMLQRGIIQEIRTFERTYLPTDNVLMFAVELGMANQYIRDLSANVRRDPRKGSPWHVLRQRTARVLHRTKVAHCGTPSGRLSKTQTAF